MSLLVFGPEYRETRVVALHRAPFPLWNLDRIEERHSQRQFVRKSSTAGMPPLDRVIPARLRASHVDPSAAFVRAHLLSPGEPPLLPPECRHNPSPQRNTAFAKHRSNWKR